jgi:phosphoadenosine phosphosulfate reductase
MGPLYDPLRRMVDLTDSVIVFYSGGKDSAVVLDLAFRHFKNVYPVLMYYVPELSFQEAIVEWAQAHYSTEVYKVPHFELSSMYRFGVFAKPDPAVRVTKMVDIYAHVREVFGCRWIVAGERCADSTIRNAMIKKSGPIDANRGRFFPLAFWTKAHVVAYIKSRFIKVTPESAILGSSFAGIVPKQLVEIRKHYPDDYRKIVAAFPLVEASVVRFERLQHDAHQVPVVQCQDGPEKLNRRVPEQPSQDQ